MKRQSASCFADLIETESAKFERCQVCVVSDFIMLLF